MAHLGNPALAVSKVYNTLCMWVCLIQMHTYMLYPYVYTNNALGKTHQHFYTCTPSLIKHNRSTRWHTHRVQSMRHDGIAQISIRAGQYTSMKVFCLYRYRYRANTLIPGNQYTIKYWHTVKYWYTYQCMLISISVNHFVLQTDEVGKLIT